ncbi:MAG TPA: ImmA/IrrE family metallo-endopeptidase [Methylomirabilota bacterium]|nr:ImmA/IrrE family metallo-endopeptidase [Methylomirabilota bacterium]
MRVVRLVLRLSCLALAGCASLTPPQQASLGEVHALVDTTTRAYGLRPVYVLVGSDVAGVGGSYRGGLLTVSTPMLLSRYRDALVAHELAHYVLGHDRPLHGSALEASREQEQRELDANATAVEILVRGRRSPDAALGLVYDYLLAFHRLVSANATVVPWGHRPPCDEIADLLERFPAQRAWTAALPCASPRRDAAHRP